MRLKKSSTAQGTDFGSMPREQSHSRRHHVCQSVKCIAVVVGLVLSADCSAEEAVPDDIQVLKWLKELKPLPKVHYSWPLPFKKLSPEMLFEYVRLTHAASISGEWGTADQVDKAVAACHAVNVSQPGTTASIAVNYSVWHRRFGKELPPTNTGPTHKAELDYLTERLHVITKLLASANKKHNANVKLTAILFDSEHFHVRKSDKAWNTAITAKYNAAYDIAREVFPDARIEWYARGAIHPGASATGWSEATYFALDEKGDSFGCSLYQVPEIGSTREIYRRTARNAEKHECKEVTPWIALASGYRRQTDKYHEFSLDWNYDLIYSWKLGLEINNAWFGSPERAERFAPWQKAKVAIFYPEPLGRSPHWAQHFVAYVRGAHSIKSLPQIEH